MNAIVASYTSSDSDEEIHAGQDSLFSVDKTQAKKFENRRDSEAESVQNSKQPNSQDMNKVRPPVLRSKCLSVHTSQSAQSQIIPNLFTSNDNSQRTADTSTKDVNNFLHTKNTNTEIKPQQNSSIREGCFKIDTVMPYIPKSKRAKHATQTEQESTDRVTSNDSLASSIFTKAKLFSRNNNSRCSAPKRRLIHFDAHQRCINRISWNPCFQDILLSASMDCRVKIWNVETTPSCVLQVSGHSQAVKDAKWNIDGVKILIGGYDKFSRINDINAGKEVCTHKHSSFVTCVLYHPSDANVYLSGTSNDGIFAWDTRTQHSICRYKSFFGQIQDLLFLPDGQSFVSAAEISRRNSTDKGIMVWDYKTSTILSNQVFQEAYTCTALQIHPNDNAFLAQCNAGYIAVFSQKTPYKLNKYKRFEGHCVSGYHIGIDVSPDGSLVASGSSDGSLYVYNYRTSNTMKIFALESQPCMDVAWSPTFPSLLASCDWNGKIFLYR